MCKPPYGGEDCGQCADGYFGEYPNCKSKFCYSIAYLFWIKQSTFNKSYQNGSNLSKIFQTCAKLFKLVQSFQTYLKLFKHVQPCSNLSKLVQNPPNC